MPQPPRLRAHLHFAVALESLPAESYPARIRERPAERSITLPECPAAWRKHSEYIMGYPSNGQEQYAVSGCVAAVCYGARI
jgi:hypothetical protein